jgi:predicted nucleic acid-binding protein
MGLVSDLAGRRVYLDTNVFIYALNGFPAYAPALAELFNTIEAGGVSAVTSELTLAELLIVPFRRGSIEEERRCRMILRPRPYLSLFPVSTSVLEAMARLRAGQAAMRTPDAIHAATAQLAECEVFLTNDHRLKAVAGLRVSLLSDICLSA